MEILHGVRHAHEDSGSANIRLAWTSRRLEPASRRDRGGGRYAYFTRATRRLSSNI
jgi:hypothetical protein